VYGLLVGKPEAKRPLGKTKTLVGREEKVLNVFIWLRTGTSGEPL
jgi:hypothetical protein